MTNLITLIIKFNLFAAFALVFSILIYLCFYYWMIPKHTLTESIFFNYDIACTQLLEKLVFIHSRRSSISEKIHQYIGMDNTENDFNENLIQQLRCQNVRYEIPDRNYRNFFKSGFHYHFELHLEMPDSTTNRDLGMFMVRLIFVNLDGKSFYEINRPALLPYTSNLLSFAKIIFFLPFYLSGYQNEIHQLQIKLLDENVNYDHIDFEQIRRIRLEIETLKPIEIIAPSKLIITCQLNGIQYWMYKWPSTTSIIVISNLFVMFTAIYLLSALISFLLKMSQASRTDESFPSIRHPHHQNRLEYNSDNQRLIESDDHIETSSVTAQKQSIRSSSSLPQLSLLNDSEQ